MIKTEHFNRYDTATTVNINHLILKYNEAQKLGFKRFDVIGDDNNIYSLKTKSLRYKLFARDHDKLKCVTCGTKATTFYLQKNCHQEDSYHANLWGINSNNELILLTKDHILRKRDGGKDNIDNLQVMCFYCNSIVKN